MTRSLRTWALFLVVCAGTLPTATGSTTNATQSHTVESYTADGQEFTNWLRTITVGGPVETMFYPTNNVTQQQQQPSKRAYIQNEDFHQGLADLQAIVQQAYAQGKQVRAYGSKWSINDMAYSNEYLVQSWGLDYCQVGIDNNNNNNNNNNDDETSNTTETNNKDYLTEDYQSISQQLVLVQSGVMVRDLNQKLTQQGLALPTTGAGDGQRMAGAISTGTHGSANGVGSMQEFVKAIHLVIPGKHVVIQKQSDPAVTAAFCQEYLDGAELMEDDAMFQAAVVSFGSFGLIHAYILQAEPLYLLKRQSKEMSYRNVKRAIQTMDVSSLGFSDIQSAVPFHFEVTLNPYRLRRSDTGAFVRVFEKVPVAPENMQETIAAALNDKDNDGDYNLFDQIGYAYEGSKFPLGTFAKRFFYGMGIDVPLRNIFGTNLGRPLYKTAPEFFTGQFMAFPTSQTSVSGIGMEIGVPLAKVQNALDLILGILYRRPIPTPVALRYVKHSEATLAFTKYDDITVTIELPGPWGEDTFTDTGPVFQEIYAALEANRDMIPHTYHWGQNFPVNSNWVKRSYGSDLEKWQEQRAILLDDGARDIFSNDVIEALGIHA